MKFDLVKGRTDRRRRMDRISIKGLEIFANHGVFKEENVLGQKFVINIDMYTSTRAAGIRDDLKLSIDYGAICNLVEKTMKEHTYKLIAHAI